jgi:hypothetical protein
MPVIFDKLQYNIIHIRIKVKVKFTLEQATKAQRGGGVKLYSSTLSLTSALDGGGWSTPRPDIIHILLTPWSRVLLDKLTINFAASQEIPLICGTRKFLTVPTRARL